MPLYASIASVCSAWTLPPVLLSGVFIYIFAIFVTMLEDHGGVCALVICCSHFFSILFSPVVTGINMLIIRKQLGPCDIDIYIRSPQQIISNLALLALSGSCFWQKMSSTLLITVWDAQQRQVCMRNVSDTRQLIIKTSSLCCQCVCVCVCMCDCVLFLNVSAFALCVCIVCVWMLFRDQFWFLWFLMKLNCFSILLTPESFTLCESC